MITNGIERMMTSLFGRSWKTTLAGLGTLFLSAVWAITNRPDGEPLKLTVLKFLATGAIPGIGLLNAKDHNVSGQRPGRPEMETFDERERH